MRCPIISVFSALGLLFLISCNDRHQEEFKVIVDKTEFSLPAEGGVVSVTFIPLTSWRAECSEDFVTISPSDGGPAAAATTVGISVAPNEDILARDITVRLVFEYNSAVVTIVQEGMSQPQPGNGKGDTEDVAIGAPID